MKRFVLLVVLFTLCGPLTTANGQQKKNFEETLKELSGDAAKAYVAPAVSGFGANQNSGWFHRAPRATMFGFDLEFGVVVMGTFFSDDKKTFNNTGTFSFDSSESYQLTKFVYSDPQYNTYSNPQKQQIQASLVNAIRGKTFSVGFSGPTLAGNRSDTVKSRFSGGTFQVPNPRTPGVDTTYSIPASIIPIGATGLFDENPIIRGIPLVSPQLTIGTFFGTQLTFRYLPSITVENFGEIKYFGFGIQHNPGVWFGDILPLDVSASFFTQSLKGGSVFESKASAFGVNASKRLGWGFLNITPYAGFMYEKSSMSFTYDFLVDAAPPTPPSKQTVRFELEGENQTRITAGLSIKILIVNINADYNWSKYNSASIGLMFII